VCVEAGFCQIWSHISLHVYALKYEFLFEIFSCYYMKIIDVKKSIYGITC